jgi:soluble lytic murein transglycosylase-like protein
MKKIHKALLSALLAGSFISIPCAAYADAAPDCLKAGAKTLNKHAEVYKADIQAVAQRYDISPALIKAVMATESCFNPVLVSSEGRIGLMQLTPTTAKRFGAFNMLNPAANIDAGARYLSYLSKRYEGSLAEVLAAYVSDSGSLWQDAPATPLAVATIHEPVNQVLNTLLKFDNNKKANRQAQALLKRWGTAPAEFQMALRSLPDPVSKATKAWFKERLARVHYARTPEARGCGGFSAQALQAKAAPYEAIIQKAAKRYGVDSALVKSVIASESCYREMVVSYMGASGLMQLMPETATELGVMDIFDPEENINGGTRYLSWLLKHYNGSFTHAIAAYNAGAGRVAPDAPVTIAFTETRGYIRNVLTHLTRFEKGKQASANAQFLLANWDQTDLAYQAVLRGETPAVAAADAVPDAALPPVIDPNQPQVTMALLRTEKVPLDGAMTDVQPNTPLQAAIDDGIVRVKRVSAMSADRGNVQPIAVEPTAMAESPAIQTLPTLPTLPVEPVVVDNALPSCNALPQPLLEQTEERGSGRYGAFFYVAQAGDTADLVANKLGLDPQDMLRVGNLPADGVLPTGKSVKVAECARTL